MSYKSFLIALLSSAIIVFPSIVFSQGEATMLFLRIPPSPTLNGMGRVGVALPTEEPLSFYYNPAQLGYLSHNFNFAFQFYPSKTEWLPQFHLEDLTVNSLAIIGGYKFKNGMKAFPLSIGIGYMRGKINYGENIQTDETGMEIGRFDSHEYYDAFAVGVGLHLYVNINFGLTYKNISSNLYPNIFVGEEFGSGTANENAFDYGILLIFPALKFLESRNESIKQVVIPYFDVSLGYAKSNIGGKVIYNSKTQADPMPRTALIGYAISTGIDMKVNNDIMRIVSFDWSSEANDILVVRKGNNITEYQGFIGDINFWDNVILGKSDNEVESHHGFRLQFVEFIGVEFGRFNGPGWGEGIKTNGYTLSLKGFMKALNLAGAGNLDFAANHFDLQYAWAKYSTDEPDAPLNNTTHHSITFSIYGF